MSRSSTQSTALAVYYIMMQCINSLQGLLKPLESQKTIPCFSFDRASAARNDFAYILVSLKKYLYLGSQPKICLALTVLTSGSPPIESTNEIPSGS